MSLSISSAISIFVNIVVNVWGIPFSINIAKKNRRLWIANGKYNIDYEEFDRLDNEIIKKFGV